MLWVSERRALLTPFFCDDHSLLPFAIDVCDRKRPEGNQIDSGVVVPVEMMFKCDFDVMPYFLRGLILDFGGNPVLIPAWNLKKLVSAGRQARQSRILGC